MSDVLISLMSLISVCGSKVRLLTYLSFAASTKDCDSPSVPPWSLDDILTVVAFFMMLVSIDVSS